MSSIPSRKEMNPPPPRHPTRDELFEFAQSYAVAEEEWRKRHPIEVKVEPLPDPRIAEIIERYLKQKAKKKKMEGETK
jgi:undecaprenyl pyrophosphate synthase